MIGLTERPPQQETPFAIFHDGAITPKQRVLRPATIGRRVPTTSSRTSSALEIKGKVRQSPLEASLKDIKKLKGGELVAVNQCSGNKPRLSTAAGRGGQTGQRRHGNARVRGVR